MTQSRTSEAVTKIVLDNRNGTERYMFRSDGPVMTAISKKYIRMEQALMHYINSQDVDAFGVPLKKSIAQEALDFDPLTL